MAVDQKRKTYKVKSQKLGSQKLRSQKLVAWALTSSILFSQIHGYAQTTESIATASSLQNTLSNRSLLKAGSTVFETADLIQLYGQRSFEPIWVKDSQPTTFVDAYKKMVQMLSLKHGLIASDYWTSEVEAYLTGLNSTNAIAVEVLLSQLYLRLASHLSDGRIEPTIIDNDVRFKKRVFTDYKVLAQAVSAQPSMMMDIVETLAPQHIYYKNTLDILADLNKIKSVGGYKVVKILKSKFD